jgi:hypothetical protein
MWAAEEQRRAEHGTGGLFVVELDAKGIPELRFGQRSFPG